MSLSKSTTPVELDTPYNYISVCGICLSTYEVPKALPCLHSFCLGCIREWASLVSSVGARESQVVSCPNCRKDCVLPASGVDDLPTNFFITERNQVDSPPVCNSCENRDREIVARCRECGFVCNECLLPHKSMRSLKNHSVIMLDSLRVGKTGKRLAKLGIGAAKVGIVPLSGTFNLEKTIDVKSVDNSGNVFCCMFTFASHTTYEVAVPAFKNPKLYIFSNDGKPKLIIDTKKGLNPGSSSQPWDVTKSADGLYYLTACNPWVTVHDETGRFIRLLQLVDVDGKKCANAIGRGITIDNKGQIIVGDGNNKIISIYKPDESFVSAFNVGITPFYITTKPSDTNVLLVSSVGESSVLEIDYSGKVLNTITLPIANMDWVPRGVRCSKMDEIFVVDGGASSCVCRFTSTWQYNGCAISDLKDPRGIAISEDGELLAVVNGGKELKIYRRS